jgi:hypothetical protein
MAKHRQYTGEPEPGKIEEPKPEPVVVSIPAELAAKWGVPVVCLESIAYAAGSIATTWAGLKSLNSENETEKRTALDTLGQTLCRVTPFNTITASYIASGDFEKWAHEISVPFAPGNEFANLMITFKTKE